MDKANNKPWLNLLVEWGIRHDYMPHRAEDDDKINNLIQLAYEYNAKGDRIRLGAVTAWLAHTYNVQSHIHSIAHSKELIEQALNHRDIEKLCCYVLDMFKTDCDCISKVCQMVFNEIKYKNAL